MKCAIEVSAYGNDKRWPEILSEAGVSNIAIDLSTFINSDAIQALARQASVPIKGAIPGYRWRQKVYKKTEKFFHLCAQYGIRTAVKRAGKHILTQQAKNGDAQPLGSAKSSVTSLVNLYAKQGLHAVLLHAPALAAEKQDASFNAQLLQLARNSIHLCVECKCPTLVLQPLFSGVPKEDAWEVNRQYFLKLLPVAKKFNVKLLLENQPRNFNGRIVRGALSDPVEAAQWIDDLNKEAKEEIFGLCLNVDTVNQCRQNIREYIQRVGNRLGAVRVNLSLGVRFSLRELILALRKIRFSGVLVCDPKYLLQGLPDSLQSAMLEVIAQTVAYIHMQIELENTLRKYPSLVLFGTGLMFHNYMRNYGHLYPPLFACDNSPEKWGTEICGVKIFPPQKLLELPQDCGVFICNRFYEAMEKQLAQMDVKHVERFNDEILAK